MKSIQISVLMTVVLSIVTVQIHADVHSILDQHQAVLEMEPVGYWPADDGDGDRLHDLSGNENHGILYHVPWENGLLDFTGAYQWAEIPYHPQYQSKDFSIGGWVFTRTKIYGGLYPGRAGMIFIGNAYHRSGYTLDTLYADPVLVKKSNWTVAGGTEQGMSLCIQKDELIDIISGGKSDALGTRAGGTAVTLGQWQHILYTYQAGRPIEGGQEWKSRLTDQVYYGAGIGKVYVNGQLTAFAEGVDFTQREMRFLIGSDAVWWLQSDQSGSLNGSIRDIVMFDRALSARQVESLYSKTHPTIKPAVFPDDAIIVKGKQVTLAQLYSLPAEQRRLALEEIEKRQSAEIQKMSAELLPVLQQAVKDWQTCRAAVTLLDRLESIKADAVLSQCLPQLMSILKNNRLPKNARAESALALARMGGSASQAVPVLVKTLQSILQLEGVRLPRVEDTLRNAVIRALLDIAPREEPVRAVLGSALAKPVLDWVDLSGPNWNDVRGKVQAGRYMDALDAYRTLPGKQRENFFSYGDPHRDNRGDGHDHSYTAVAQYNGWVYTVGQGKGFQGVEPISPQEFTRQVNKLSLEYPDAKNWRKAGDPHLYRVSITKTDENGNEQKVYLEGDGFILDGHDAKVRGWSIAADSQGYLHLTGGKHNNPNPTYYIPGSWEKMGASREYTDDNFPSLLYWVSEKPGDITSFQFVGQRSNPRNVPVPDGLNYMVFVQDQNGVLYLYGRIHVQGIQSWGLYRYDTNTKRWTALGGFAQDVVKEFPLWADRHIEMACDSFALCTMRWKNTASENRVLAWSLQPHFYNYCRSMWGVKFDRTNRMHVQVPIFGLDDQNHNINKELYAYSDDGGETFYRADGRKLALPLSANPGPGYAAMESDSTRQWWDLWRLLMRDAGLNI